MSSRLEKWASINSELDCCFSLDNIGMSKYDESSGFTEWTKKLCYYWVLRRFATNGL